jgi:hypothetical protein
METPRGAFFVIEAQAMTDPPPLRNQLLETCWASGLDVNHVVQAAVDVLMISLIALGPDADAAERNIRRITDDMLANIRQSYAEYHAMVAAQRNTRQ